MRWRLVLVDDHPVVRRGIRDTIAGEGGLEVVAEAASADDAMSEIGKQKPDLAIVDISLGRTSGLDLIKRIRTEYPQVKVLVLSVHDEDLYAERALRAGADGYVSKNSPPDKIVSAVRTVLSGGTALSDSITGRLVQQAVRGGESESKGIESLSNRELEVFQLIGTGLTTRKIAEQLCISIKTVETHRENIKHKVNVSNASELVRYAVAWVENPS